jgi:hypothetical protein
MTLVLFNKNMLKIKYNYKYKTNTKRRYIYIYNVPISTGMARATTAAFNHYFRLPISTIVGWNRSLSPFLRSAQHHEILRTRNLVGYFVFGCSQFYFFFLFSFHGILYWGVGLSGKK